MTQTTMKVVMVEDLVDHLILLLGTGLRHLQEVEDLQADLQMGTILKEDILATSSFPPSV